MSFSTKEYLNKSPDRLLFHKLLYELKCWFSLSAWKQFSLAATDFSSQLYFILAKIKTTIGVYMYVTSSLSQYKKKFPCTSYFFHIRACPLYTYSMSNTYKVLGRGKRLLPSLNTETIGTVQLQHTKRCDKKDYNTSSGTHSNFK